MVLTLVVVIVLVRGRGLRLRLWLRLGPRKDCYAALDQIPHISTHIDQTARLLRSDRLWLLRLLGPLRGQVLTNVNLSSDQVTNVGFCSN